MKYFNQYGYTGEIVETPKDFVRMRENIQESLNGYRGNMKMLEDVDCSLFDEEDAMMHREYVARLEGKISALEQVLAMFPIIWIKDKE